ncbi:hypothetical protein SDC9_99232 [bioreactor metagenome]|uniref:Uncharacterized protein n=1 Tax=bioreactor metagenome TaxID=1076179 RepID=A0A645ANP6_9ZZZZ
MLRQSLENLHLVQELLVSLGRFGGPFHAAVHHFQIGHHQLQVDSLDIAQRVHRYIGTGIRHHMHDVFVVEAADHVDNGVRLPDVGQELVAKACPLARALDQPRNIHEFDDCRGLLIRLIHLRESVQPLIRHGHHSHIGIDGAEGVIGALRTGIGNCVEQSALAHIGQAHDSKFHSRNLHAPRPRPLKKPPLEA